jgi:hypothetical protein
MRAPPLLLGIATSFAVGGCLLPRHVEVRPSHGGGEYRFTFRDRRTGQPALGYGYSIEYGQSPLLAILGRAYSGGPLDLQASTEWTLEDDPNGTWTVRLEPPHRPNSPRREKPAVFNLEAIFKNSGRHWPARFRVLDEPTRKWELVAEKIGPARY